MHNFNVLIRDVDDEETDSGGTYTYSVWSYSGKAVRKAD